MYSYHAPQMLEINQLSTQGMIYSQAISQKRNNLIALLITWSSLSTRIKHAVTNYGNKWFLVEDIH
jgi:hypothetical protein